MEQLQYNSIIRSIFRRGKLFYYIAENVLLSGKFIEDRHWLHWKEDDMIHLYKGLPSAKTDLAIDIEYLRMAHLIIFKTVDTELYVSLTKTGSRYVIGFNLGDYEMLIKSNDINDLENIIQTGGVKHAK